MSSEYVYLNLGILFYIFDNFWRHRESTSNLPCISFYKSYLCQLCTQINATVSSFCRHQYFLHLKRDLDEGKIIPDPEKAATVYALIAQATIGDHGDSYSPCDFCQASEVESQWSSEFRSNVSVEHAKFKGLRPAAAKQFFIKELSSMENYGMEYHLAKNESGQSLHIGVGSEEIKIYDGDLNFIERYE